jgi:hypothetical protein
MNAKHAHFSSYGSVEARAMAMGILCGGYYTKYEGEERKVLTIESYVFNLLFLTVLLPLLLL